MIKVRNILCVWWLLMVRTAEIIRCGATAERECAYIPVQLFRMIQLRTAFIYFKPWLLRHPQRKCNVSACAQAPELKVGLKQPEMPLSVSKLPAMLLLLCVCLLLRGFAFAQPPGIQWQRSIGGSGNEMAFSVQPAHDHGLILAGTTNSANGDVTYNHGDFDCWLVKLDSNSGIMWQKSYGGSSEEEAFGVVPGTYGGYVFTGQTLSSDGDLTTSQGDFDTWIVATDDTGHILWSKSMGSSGPDYGIEVRNTPDSGYIIVGGAGAGDGDVTSTYRGGSGDAWVIKLTHSGVVSWSKTYGGSDLDYGIDIQPCAGGGYIFAGQTVSTDGDISVFRGAADAWVMKLDDTGKVIWSKTYGGSDYEDATSIVQSADGGFIFTGFTKSLDGDVAGNHGGDDYWVVKLDDTGGIVWSKCYGGTQYDDPSQIVQTPDGGYLIAGVANSTDGDVTGNHGSDDYWVVKLDNTGALQWQKSVGGTSGDTANCIAITSDTGYVIAGGSGSSNGDLTATHGNGDFWVLKLHGPDTTLGIAATGAEQIAVYPTVTTGRVEVVLPVGYEQASFQLFSLVGSSVPFTESRSGLRCTLELRGIPAATYILKIVNKGVVRTFRVVFLG